MTLKPDSVSDTVCAKQNSDTDIITYLPHEGSQLQNIGLASSHILFQRQLHLSNSCKICLKNVSDLRKRIKHYHSLHKLTKTSTVMIAIDNKWKYMIVMADHNLHLTGTKRTKIISGRTDSNHLD